MNQKSLKIFVLASLIMGLSACTEPSAGDKVCEFTSKCSEDGKSVITCVDGEEKAPEACEFGCSENKCNEAAPECQNVCKDDKTLTKCNADGTTTDEDCPNGCDKTTNTCKAATEEPKECKDVCKDDNTLTKCNVDGTTTDEDCPNGCDKTTNTCKAATEEPKKCKSVCKDARTLLKCNEEDGTITEETCNYIDEICTFGECEKTSLPTTCNKVEKKCLGDAIVYECVDNGYENMPDLDLYVGICSAGRTCQDGLCIAEEGKASVNHCKDLKTLVECTDGVCADKACLAGELCIHDACVETEIKACESDANCGGDETCYDKICYRKADLEKAVGDPCSMNDFQEYCKDGKEYKCGYDSTVEVNDCADFNGCSLILDMAYPGYKKGVRDAACRGETEDLKQCTAGGVTTMFCFEGISSELSNRHACTLGTDGRYVYSWNRDEITCEATCNVETGLCN